MHLNAIADRRLLTIPTRPVVQTVHPRRNAIAERYALIAPPLHLQLSITGLMPQNITQRLRPLWISRAKKGARDPEAQGVILVE